MWNISEVKNRHMQCRINSRNLSWLSSFPKVQPKQQISLNDKKRLLDPVVIQTWFCLVKESKPVPVVAENKPLCFLKHRKIQPRLWNIRSKHSQWRLSPAAHVLSCWCRGSAWGSSSPRRASQPVRKERETSDSKDETHLPDASSSNHLTSAITVHEVGPLICQWWFTTEVTNFASQQNNQLLEISMLLFSKHAEGQLCMSHTFLVWSNP